MRVTPTGTVLVIMISATTLAIALALGRALMSPFGHTTSQGSIEHTVVGHRFRVPKAYISLREDWQISKEFGSSEGILMEGTLPDIAPYSEVTAHLYKDGVTPDEAVSFSLWGIKYGTGLWDDYYTQEFLSQCNNERAGFMVCKGSTDSREVLVRVRGKKKIALECAKEGTNPRNSCQGQFPLFDNIRLQINFVRIFLDQTETISARVYELVCGFYVPGGPPVTYNYCENGVYHGK